MHLWLPIFFSFIININKYMRNLIKSNLMLAKKFGTTMRYIDDLLTLKIDMFHSAIVDINPNSRKLQSHLQHCHA